MKLITKTILLFQIIFMLTLSGCKKGYIVKTITAKGISKENHSFFGILFPLKKTGLLAGSVDDIISLSDGHNFASLKRSTKIYRTIDGGNNWKDCGINVEGCIQKISLNRDSSVYAISISEVTNHSTIYASIDFGNSWNKLTSYNNIVTDLIKINDSVNLMIAKDSNNIFNCFKYYANGKCEKISGIPKPIVDLVNTNNNVYFLVDPNQKGKEQLVVSLNYFNNSMLGIKMPVNLEAPRLYSYDQKVYLCGESLGYIKIYELSTANTFIELISFSKRSDSDFFKYFYTSNSKIILLIGRRNGVGVSNQLYFNTINNNNWNEIELDDDVLVSPFTANSQNGSIIIYLYSIRNLIQTIEIF